MAESDLRTKELRKQVEEFAAMHRRETSWAHAARRIERSRTWRLGDFLVRALRVLSLRRPVPSSGPSELAAEIEASATMSLVKLAALSAAEADWNQAAERLQEVVDRFADSAPPVAYRRLSQARRMLDSWEAAEAALAQGLERFPDDVGLQMERAETAMAAGEWDEAVVRWRALLDRLGDEAPAGVRVGLVRALLNTGDEEAADAVVARRAVWRLDDYQEWILANDALTQADRAAIRERIATMQRPPTFSVVVPVYNPRTQHLRQALDSVLAQLYPHWELCVVDDASTDPGVREMLAAYANRDARITVRHNADNTGIAGATNAALELAGGEWVALLDHDDVLAEHALYLMAEAVAADRNAAVLYSDSDHLDEHERRTAPHFKPDWDPDLFLGQNYVNHLGVYRADLVRAVGGFREDYEGSQDWDFALRVIEAAGEDPVVHVPHVLYHWRISQTSFSRTNLQNAADAASRAVSEHLKRRGLQARVKPGIGPAWQRIEWAIPSPAPRVSAIVPSRDRLELLRPCIDGLLEHTDYPDVEVVVVDNGSSDAKTLEYLRQVDERDDVRVLRQGGEFNFAGLCNRGVEASDGEVVLLLNNDIEIIYPEWLGELVGHAMRPEVGAVGAKLYYANGSIQHAGVVLGAGKMGIADHAYRFMPQVSEPGEPFGRMRLTRNCSAVTAACMALRREVYEEVSGLDEVNLPVSYNDVDLCLRIREAGYRVVWTPFARLRHHETISRGANTTPEAMERARAAADYMHARWGNALGNDPFFNPNLSLSVEDFTPVTPTRAPKPWRAEPRSPAVSGREPDREAGAAAR